MFPQPNIIIDLESNTVNKSFTVRRELYPSIVPRHLDPEKVIKSFRRETKCLTLLEKNFINEPKINHFPFPKIIVSKLLNITMTYCGDTLKSIEKKHRKKKIDTKQWLTDNLDYNYLHNTLECITNNLVKNNIKHKDIKNKNICIDKNYNIHLIDFEFIDLQAYNLDPDYIKKKLLSCFNLERNLQHARLLT